MYIHVGSIGRIIMHSLPPSSRGLIQTGLGQTHMCTILEDSGFAPALEARESSAYRWVANTFS